jgi:hypothetical protein
MSVRLLAALLVAAVAPLAARAADDEHPYKNVKVGDFVTYKMTMKFAGMDITGEMTQTVTAKSDKEVTVKASGKMGGQDVPESEQKIDLTKPYDPTKAATPPGTDAKVEKQKDGKEKVKVGDKTYEATWTTYKMTASAMGQEMSGDFKVWTAKDVPFGMAKMESTMTFAGNEMKMAMEMKESGRKDK